jgi:hypothetical protein
MEVSGLLERQEGCSKRCEAELLAP